MQRLFVMFPDRGPGIGLLWLRLCLSAALLGTSAASASDARTGRGGHAWRAFWQVWGSPG
ncbi:hypothetical protein C7E18_21740 [Stenotrophomonas maltophilia]|nr:hypothetical protein C7E18_21740 [Stenotrophomonas maltophilia]